MPSVMRYPLEYYDIIANLKLVCMVKPMAATFIVCLFVGVFVCWLGCTIEQSSKKHKQTNKQTSKPTFHNLE